nr:rhodanese-like domain-containing protein [Galbitalea soli]
MLAEPIVSTQWLADHLGSDRLLVVDASVVPYAHEGRSGYVTGHENYIVTGHIPGAVFADLIEEFSDPEGAHPFTRPGLARFQAAATALGVDNSTAVVVYDSGVGQWASRLWWLFRAFGYDRVAVLDGGLQKWTAEERAIELGHVEPRPTDAGFVATERPELWVTTAEVEAIVDGSAPGSLVCAVPPKEFSGEAGSRPRPGHIPGSISAPAGRLVDRTSNALLPESALRDTFAPVLGGERVVAYCGAGIAAAAGALALTLLGERSVALYDGSLNEWTADERRPLVTSA